MSKINKKNVPKKCRLQDIPDSDIHSSSFEESDFSVREADTDAEFLNLCSK